jgi:uncharacterized protein YbaP (TraB family)
MRHTRRVFFLLTQVLCAYRGLPAMALVLVLWSGLAGASDLHPLRHGEGRLWRIERGEAAPSHIMGTMHVSDPRVRDLPAPIREAFEASEQAAFELLMTPEERQAAAQMGSCDCSAGKPLSKLVDRATFKRAVELAGRYGIPEKAVDKMQPGALAWLFQTPPDEIRRRADGDLFLDLYLIQWAYDLGKRVVALEKLEEQIGALESAPEADQVDILREVIDRLEEDPDAHEQLIEDYVAGNMTRVFREMYEDLENDPAARAFKEAMLDDRNQTMVKRMIPLLQRGSAFVAVGAAHLPGEEGVLYLLEQQGYRVTRVY